MRTLTGVVISVCHCTRCTALNQRFTAILQISSELYRLPFGAFGVILGTDFYKDERVHFMAEFTAKGANILVVDDDDDIREIVHILLAREGFTVREAANAEQALRRLDPLPDLVILDVMMPGPVRTGKISKHSKKSRRRVEYRSRKDFSRRLLSRRPPGSQLRMLLESKLCLRTTRSFGRRHSPKWKYPLLSSHYIRRVRPQRLIQRAMQRT